MSIAPPPSNSSASSTTDIAPTHTTSKVLEGHEPNIPPSVSDKYNEGLEDPSKRPKENIHAQEDFIASLPRKDVSFGAEAALDRDRVPLVKRTEVHAVPAETSQENLLKDKQIEVSDVQIPHTQPQSSLNAADSGSAALSSDRESESNSMLTKQELESKSPPLNQDADTVQDSIQESTSAFKDKLSKQDKQLEEAATQHQQNLIAEKKEHEGSKETETPEFQQDVAKHNEEVDKSTELDVPTPPTKETQPNPSTAKKWEEKHIQPLDIPQRSEQARETREKPTDTTKSSDSVLPTDQYDLKSQSDLNSNKQESKLVETVKSSEHMIQEKLSGLVHTITHDLPTAARELLNEYEASKSKSSQRDKSSSDGMLPTDQYDLKTSEQKPAETSKSTDDKILEEKHVEPLDDHKSEPAQHHFIQDKIAGLMHTVTHDLPARAKELLTKHEENKSQPPSPTQAPTITEREEKQVIEQSGGQAQDSSVIKQRGLDPEEMLFF